MFVGWSVAGKWTTERESAAQTMLSERKDPAIMYIAHTTLPNTAANRNLLLFDFIARQQASQERDAGIHLKNHSIQYFSQCMFNYMG